MKIIAFPASPERQARRKAHELLVECRALADEERYLVRCARAAHDHVRILRHSCQVAEMEYYGALMEEILQEDRKPG